MPARIRTRAVPLGLSALALLLALLQRPGWASSDTKIDLHTDPVGFLGDVTHLWSPSSGLGGVESAQYAGYLFPMGPFFALGHSLGLSAWLVDRLWLALLLAGGCWGMVRLAEALGAARTDAGAIAAGLLYLLNPYVVVFANRTTITLLAYALMPWLVLVAWRGVHAPRGWRLPALFALLVTSSGAGVNLAVVAFALLPAIGIVLFEVVSRAASWRAAWSFSWRCAATALPASLWWMAPAGAQAIYGIDFLRFTEPAGAIWATTSLSESFRAMGYWITYIGVGFNGVVRPYFSDAGTLLFNHVVVTATLLVPGLALLGFAWTRRRRYAAYLLLLVLIGTIVMAVGFPEGTPLRKGATFAYNHFPALRFLRTTYKAAPLVVLGVAGLGAMAVEMTLARTRLRALVAVAGCALAALAAWPLVKGEAVDPQVTWKEIPAGWRSAAADLDRTLGANERAAVLPGQLYAFYRWGGTVDPILPSLSDRPTAVRNAVPYGDLRGTDLLWTTDALVQQGRLVPGQLAPLLQLMSVGQVVAATDDDVNRSGAIDPRAAVRALSAQGLPLRRRYGPDHRRFAVPEPRPLVRIERRGPTTVVDGGAGALADLAAMDALGGQDAIAYAGDLGAERIAAAARAGGSIVISDSNRRRVQVVSRMAQNTGWTLAASEPISQDAATLNPFAALGSDAQTVAVFHGLRNVSAPFSPGYSQFPEHRPFAAVDGDPRTAWLADPALSADRHVLTLELARPRDVDAIRVLPRNEGGARTVALDVNGKRFDVGAGWQRLALGLRGVRTLRIKVVAGKTESAAAGGLAEVQVPGLRVTESLRPPLLAERALRDADLSHAALAYSFSRASGDNPARRAGSHGVRVRRMVEDSDRLEHLRVRGAGDEEVGIDRVIAPPVARTYDVSAWVSATPEAPDSAIDRLVGARGALAVDSSGRFEGRPGYRGSSALDGDTGTAWIARADVRPWIRVSARTPFSVSQVRVTPAAGAPAPRRVRFRWAGGETGPLAVQGGIARLGRRIRTRTLTMDVLGAAGDRVGVAELEIAGLALRPRRSGPIEGCGAVAVHAGGREVPLRIEGSVADLDAGRPLRARGCSRLELGEGRQRIRIPPRTLRPDRVLLSAPAPDPIARIAVPAGAVTDPGKPGRGRRDDVGLDVQTPAWLLLGESYNRGWRAWCGERSLGEPVPLDGYANAWPVEPGCTTARFAFAPQGPMHLIQLLSGLACLLLLGLVLLPRGRAGDRRAADAAAADPRASAAADPRAAAAADPRAAAAADPRAAAAAHPRAAAAADPRANAAADPSAAEWPDPPPSRLPLARAALISLVAGAALAFCFSLRSGLLIAPGIAFVLWRGVAAGPLAIAGGLLLAIAVPLAYILFPAEDLGGYNPSFAGDQIGGHWLAAAAWVLLALALVRVLSTARRLRGGPSAGPADAAD